MFKKIYTMQKFLFFNSGLLSLSDGSKNKFAEQKYSLSDKLFILTMLIISYLFTFLIDNFLITIISATISTITIGGFLTYNSDILSMIPISKKFTFFNLHLFSYLIFIVNFLFLSFPVILYHKISQPYMFEESTSSGAIILVFFIIVIFYSVMLAIMFIKNKLLRYVLAIGFSFVYLIFLVLFKSKLCIKDLAFINDLTLLFRFSSNTSDILLYFGLISLILIVLSLIISYSLYIRKPFKTT